MEFFNFALGEKDYETKTLLVSPDGNTEDDIPSGWNTLLEVDPLANDDGIDEQFVFGKKQNLSASVTLSQLIFDGSYLVALQASKAYVKISEQANEKTNP